MVKVKALLWRLVKEPSHKPATAPGAASACSHPSTGNQGILRLRQAGKL
jgi:hypothetical protein